MLATTLNTKFETGTNLTGGLACAAWRFLLPSMECEKTVCLGIPSLATLSVLAGMSEAVEVCSAQAEHAELLRQELKQHELSNITVRGLQDWSRVPAESRSVSLLCVNFESSPSLALGNEQILRELGRVLQPGGAIYFELTRHADRRALQSAKPLMQELGLKSLQSFWLTPASGELRTAFPVGQHDLSAFLFTNVLFGQSLKMRTASRVGALLSKTRQLDRVMTRRAILLQKTALNGKLPRAPRYLMTIAEQAGVDLSTFRLGLSARGKYNANKNIFFLFDQNSDEANAVVKMTRAPEFNYRLENEYRVLKAIHEHGYAEDGTYPQALFFGSHAGMAVLGQKAVKGEPFRRRTSGKIDCPIARDAIDWIVRLGANSAKPAADPEQAASALREIFRRFDAAYQLPEDERAFLIRQINAVAASPSFPTVFQHGDPGAWNIMVSPLGRVIVIDWEAGETEGMPLWDFFYFIRSYASWMCRQQGNRDSLKCFEAKFLQQSELTGLLNETLKRYCSLTGLVESLVAPLFYTCWMHRALKESTRLAREQLHTGHYIRLLRLCMKHERLPFWE